MKILALGPEGTNGHEAATRVMRQTAASSNPTIELCDSHAVIFERVEQEPCIAVVPIENSIEGHVTDTVKGFWLKRPLNWPGIVSILGELELPIEHVLVARPGMTPDANTPVLSHPQALGQCRENLQRLGLVNQVSTKSTAGAGKIVATDDQHARSAALVPPLAVKVYGLNVVHENMGDMPNNVTRFHVLGHTGGWPPTGDCKTALIVWLRDMPHALHNVTWAIGAAGANMSSMQFLSLGTPGRCAFYVEFNEHKGTKEGSAIMQRLQTVTDRVLWLGSFLSGKSTLERNYSATRGYYHKGEWYSEGRMPK